ncbi:MAG: hypothetical protein KatS3mg005_0595 [Bryobacteraceae bacterium]|nr:MAG: hypothetical protein KatS3mg005_0595 [Bryobacteraceae bacterium]
MAVLRKLLQALLWGGLAVHAQDPDPLEIIRRSVEKDRLNFERANDYSYVQHTEQRMLDKDGRVAKVESRTYDVIVIDGEPYEKLIAKDGKPLSESEARKEQEKLDRELARRRAERPDQRARRLSEQEKRRREGREFAREIPDAFTFRLAGQETLEGRPVWVIEAEPKPGYKGKAKRADLLSKFRGKLWIDQQDFQWVRVEAETIAPVRFGWILAKLDPGAKMTFEQRRVHGEVWLPSQARMRLDARLALVRKLRAEVEVTWRDYRKFQTDSRITEVSEITP